MNNIILTGFAGCGKTELGKNVAQKIGWTFIDIDHIIEAQEQKPIREIFAVKGEPHFRQLEKNICLSLKGDKQVISTGGGTVIDPENVNHLKDLGPLILIDTPLKLIFERVKGTSHRPLFNDENEEANLKKIEDLYNLRRKTYQEVADIIVSIESNDIQEGINKILEKINDFTPQG